MDPKRGEIWWVNFEPPVGSEMKKMRPSVVVNVEEAGALPLRIVVPITEYDEGRVGLFWFFQFNHQSTIGCQRSHRQTVFK